jgi:hypothetical protein
VEAKSKQTTEANGTTSSSVLTSDVAHVQRRAGRCTVHKNKHELQQHKPRTTIDAFRIIAAKSQSPRGWDAAVEQADRAAIVAD